MSTNQAIEQVEKKMKEKETLLREHEARLSVLQSNGFQLGNIYLVFQGVILTAIASSNKVFTCDDSRLLIPLSVLAACPNLAALYLIGQGYIRTMFQRDHCVDDLDEFNAVRSRLNNNRDQQLNPGQTPTTGGTPPRGQTPTTGGTPPGGQTPTTGGTPPRGQTPTTGGTPPRGQTPTTGGTPPRGQTPAAGTPPLPDPATRVGVDNWKKLKRTVVLYGCMAFLVAVSVMMVLTCRNILCREVADCKLPSSLSKKCIRLCDEGSKCLTICRN